MNRRVGYVLKRYPRISETFIASELVELARQGERVIVFAVSRPAEPLTHRFVDELDVQVVYLPHRPLREPRRVLRALWRLVASRPAAQPLGRVVAGTLVPPSIRSVRRLLQAAVLAAELRDAGVDHVHAHFATTAARLAQLASRLGGPPYSVTAHAKDIYHRDVRAGRLADVLGNARFVATVTEANVAHLEGVLGGRAPVTLVPNSVDLSRMPGPETRRPEPGLVLTVARLVEKKGLCDLVRACGLLTRRGVTCRLEVVGDGPLRSELDALARAADADVRFRGVLDHDDVLTCYRRAAVFALPCVVASTGDRDGLPTSVLEAMAVGVPVVTTAVNGLAQVVIDGETGLVVPPHAPDPLADAIGSLLANPADAAALGTAGHQRVAARYSTDASVARLRRLFDWSMQVG